MLTLFGSWKTLIELCSHLDDSGVRVSIWGKRAGVIGTPRHVLDAVSRVAYRSLRPLRSVGCAGLEQRGNRFLHREARWHPSHGVRFLCAPTSEQRRVWVSLERDLTPFLLFQEV